MGLLKVAIRNLRATLISLGTTIGDGGESSGNRKAVLIRFNEACVSPRAETLTALWL
jgi:hypothetical protein